MALTTGKFVLTNIATGQVVDVNIEHAKEVKIEDKITPEYNETYAFGKFDPIVNWKNTKRTVGVSFVINKGGIDVSSEIAKFANITLPKYSAGEAIYVTSSPIYKLGLFGYFQEFGIVKNLSVLPNFTPKKLVFSLATNQIDDIGAGNPVLDSEGKKYSITSVGVSFDFTVLHKVTPNVDVSDSIGNNWPFIVAKDGV